MKKLDKNVWIILLAVGVFILVVFLPKIDAFICNTKYINKPTMVKKDKDGGIHYDLTIQDKLEIVSNNQADVVIQVSGTESIDEINNSDANLFGALQREIKTLEQKRIIPVIKEKMEMKEHLTQANYYSISNNTGIAISVPVWELEFRGEGSYSYRFVIDAATYKIYALLLCVKDEDVENFLAECEKEPKPRETTPEYIFAENMLNKLAVYYEADSGYVSNMYGMDFYSIFNYKDDYKGVNVEIAYNISNVNTPAGSPDINGYRYVMLGVPNVGEILQGYNIQY